LDRQVAAAADAGFRLVGLDVASIVEWELEHPDRPAASILGEHGVQCHELAVIRVEESIDEPTLERYAAVAATIEPLWAVVVVDMQIDRAVPWLSAARSALAETGAHVAIEPLAWTEISDIALAAEVCRQVGADVKIVLDSWQLFSSGTPVDSVGELDADEIAFVQLSDGTSPRSADLRAASSHERRLPGAGTDDIRGFLSAVARAGFVGTVSLEVLSDLERIRPLPEAARDAWNSIQFLWPTGGTQ
jgi:sugar phosphate isomerase/epimerase